MQWRSTGIYSTKVVHVHRTSTCTKYGTSSSIVQGHEYSLHTLTFTILEDSSLNFVPFSPDGHVLSVPYANCPSVSKGCLTVLMTRNNCLVALVRLYDTRTVAISYRFTCTCTSTHYFVLVPERSGVPVRGGTEQSMHTISFVLRHVLWISTVHEIRFEYSYSSSSCCVGF